MKRFFSCFEFLNQHFKNSTQSFMFYLGKGPKDTKPTENQWLHDLFAPRVQISAIYNAHPHLERDNR